MQQTETINRRCYRHVAHLPHTWVQGAKGGPDHQCDGRVGTRPVGQLVSQAAMHGLCGAGAFLAEMAIAS